MAVLLLTNEKLVISPCSKVNTGAKLVVLISLPLSNITSAILPILTVNFVVLGLDHVRQA